MPTVVCGTVTRFYMHACEIEDWSGVYICIRLSRKRKFEHNANIGHAGIPMFCKKTNRLIILTVLL